MKNSVELKTGPWFLKDLETVPKNFLTVFSCFHCGGGSTMGYKLAGFNALGGVEIDPKMMAVYRANHKPKHSYLMPIQEFKNIPNSELPPELFNLDVLDGSPPCSSFSMAGAREKKWSKAHAFREGQAVQVLDDLFFHFIDIAKKLKPKVVVAENVKGLIQGKAKGYVKEIFKAFYDAGYSCQLFLLNSSKMGVPQTRERTFFIANKLGKKIELDFNEKEIPISTAFNGINEVGPSLTGQTLKLWEICQPGKALATVHPKGHWFTTIKLAHNKPSATVTASQGNNQLLHWNRPNGISYTGYIRLQSFPDDFNFLNQIPKYICGMSVPPFMMKRVANQIAIQLFNR